MENKETQETVRKIKLITESIWEHYEILRSLEGKGLKDSLEYKMALGRLESSLFLEESLYGNLPQDISELEDILYELLEDDSVDFDYSVTFAKDDNKNDLINYRIAKRIISLKDRMLKEHIKNDVVAMSFSDRVLKIPLLGMKSLEDLIKSDIWCSILFLLEGYINNEAYASIKGRLVRFKYDIAFMNSMENSLDKKFIAPKELYLTSKCSIDLFNIDSYVQTCMQNDYACRLYDIFVDGDVFSTPTSVKDDLYETSIAEILLRVAFLISDEEARGLFTEDLVQNAGFDSLYSPLKEEFLHSLFDKCEVDKASVNIVGFKMS